MLLSRRRHLGGLTHLHPSHPPVRMIAPPAPVECAEPTISTASASTPSSQDDPATDAASSSEADVSS